MYFAILLFNQCRHIVSDSEKEGFGGLLNLRSGTPKYERRPPWRHTGDITQVQPESRLHTDVTDYAVTCSKRGPL